MDIYELFERSYADQTGESAEWIKGFRMRNGSYALAKISAAFRYFKAGFEANQGEKMQVLGFLSPNGVLSAHLEKCSSFKAKRTDTYFVPVYVKDCDALNKGVE